jgi:hypothetical protein
VAPVTDVLLLLLSASTEVTAARTTRLVNRSVTANVLIELEGSAQAALPLLKAGFTLQFVTGSTGHFDLAGFSPNRRLDSQRVQILHTLLAAYINASCWVLGTRDPTAVAIPTVFEDGSIVGGLTTPPDPWWARRYTAAADVGTDGCSHTDDTRHAAQRAELVEYDSVTARKGGVRAAWTRPDVLVVVVEGLSRQLFRRALPRSVAVLGQDARWRWFPKHAAIGSQPAVNQRALFFGAVGDGADHSTSTSSLTTLWRRAGYVTAVASTACTEHEGRDPLPVFSLQADHGSELRHQFCQGRRRWGCLGHEQAARVLFNHSTTFMHLYKTQPKATILHVADGASDETGAVLRNVDAALAALLTSREFANAEIVLTSTTGPRSGSYFQTPTGLAEHQSPVLAIRTARNIDPQAAHQATTTPLDIHATLLEISGLDSRRSQPVSWTVAPRRPGGQQPSVSSRRDQS